MIVGLCSYHKVHRGSTHAFLGRELYTLYKEGPNIEVIKYVDTDIP